MNGLERDEMEARAAAAWRGRAEGIARAATGSAAWQPFALLALWDAAVSRRELTSDDVWTILHRRGVPDPAEHRAIGPTMLAGKSAGIIRTTDRTLVAAVPATNRHAGAPQRVYLSRVYGQPPAQWPDMALHLATPAGFWDDAELGT